MDTHDILNKTEKTPDLTGIVWCHFELGAGWRVEQVIPPTRDVLSINLPDICPGFGHMRLRVRASAALAKLKPGQFFNPRKILGI